MSDYCVHGLMLNTGCPSCVEIKIKSLQETAARRLELLKELEWSSFEVDVPYSPGRQCSICGASEENKEHYPDCKLAAEIKGA